MNIEEELLYKRFIELARKSDSGYYTFSDFLGLMEQSVFNEAKFKFGGVKYSLFGGAEGCERVMVRFGDPEDLGYEEPFPIKIILAEPKAPKFADKLSHRDFLGAILNLGIERKAIGDIIIKDNSGYIFVKDDMAEYVASTLEKVKRTAVKAQITDTLPNGELFKTELKMIQLSGERIDAVISKIYSISREDSISLFKKRLVFVSGKLCENNSYVPKTCDVISVRGFGRFIYRGITSTSKKGKLNALVEMYV